MTLEVCPSCEIQDSIFLAFQPAVGLDGTLCGGRIEAFCNNTRCDQRYWYFPQSYRVTRRNTGNTYAEWQGTRFDLTTINASRKRAGLSAWIDEGELARKITALGAHSVPVTLGEDGPERWLITVDNTNAVSRLRQYFYEKWCLVRAFFVVYVPGFGRFSASDDNDA